MGKSRYIIFVTLGLLIFNLVGCNSNNNSNSDISVVLDWAPNTNHTGLIVALENGYYAEEGLNVKIIQPPEDGALPIIASGKAQFGIDFQETLGMALDANENIPIAAVASIINHNTSGILSLKEKGIDSFSKLENNIYSTWNSPFEIEILKQVMYDDGGDFSKVKIYPSTATDAISALNTNVDAIWAFEAWDVMEAKLQGIDYNFIKFKDINPIFDYYTPIIVGNTQFLKNNDEISKKFLKATQKGYEFCINNSEKAAEILVNKYPEINIKLVKESQKYLANEYKAEQNKWGYIDKTRWNTFYKWLNEKKIINNSLENKGFTNEYLPK